MKYYTADLHLGHENIIRYCNRPFASVEEMDEAMVANWNARVTSNDDDVYVVGDIAFRNAKSLSGYLERLNGRIHLIWGNHDSNQTRKLPIWASSSPYAEIKDGGEHLILCHYGMRVWNGSHYGSFHLYGHSHGTLPAQGRSLDVGVDCWDFRPVTLPEIKERLTELGLIDDYGLQKKGQQS